MYTYETVVGYSKTKGGQVPIYDIMNYLQDCSTFQSEHLGRGIEYAKNKGKAWVLIAYEIQLLKPLKMGDRITVGTAPTGFQTVLGDRQFFIKDEAGEFAVQASTLWGMMDLKERIPIRFTEEDVEGFVPEKLFDMKPVNRRMKLSEKKEKKEPMFVLKTYIDSNGHMNNADYLRAATELIPEDFTWNHLKIVYKKEAREGEKMIPYIHQEEDGMGISFQNEAGEDLALIHLSEKNQD